MERDQFERAVLSTRTLLEAAFGGVAIGACRVPDDPTQAAHLSWMLAEALAFNERGSIAKANRWLGYVQGVMCALSYATLDELKRANMPEGAGIRREEGVMLLERDVRRQAMALVEARWLFIWCLWRRQLQLLGHVDPRWKP